MKRTTAAATAFAAIVAIASAAAPAQPILYTYTGLPGAVDTCKWFDDNLADRSVEALTRQTDLIYNRIALPADAEIVVGGTATSLAGDQLVDFKLGSKTVCSSARAVYPPTPDPSTTP